MANSVFQANIFRVVFVYTNGCKLHCLCPLLFLFEERSWEWHQCQGFRFVILFGSERFLMFQLPLLNDGGCLIEFDKMI